LGVQGEELEAKRKVENEKRLRESGVDGWWKNQTQFVCYFSFLSLFLLREVLIDRDMNRTERRLMKLIRN